MTFKLNNELKNAARAAMKLFRLKLFTSHNGPKSVAESNFKNVVIELELFCKNDGEKIVSLLTCKSGRAILQKICRVHCRDR